MKLGLSILVLLSSVISFLDAMCSNADQDVLSVVSRPQQLCSKSLAEAYESAYIKTC